MLRAGLAITFAVFLLVFYSTTAACLPLPSTNSRDVGSYPIDGALKVKRSAPYDFEELFPRHGHHKSAPAALIASNPPSGQTPASQPPSTSPSTAPVARHKESLKQRVKQAFKKIGKGFMIVASGIVRGFGTVASKLFPGASAAIKMGLNKAANALQKVGDKIHANMGKKFDKFENVWKKVTDPEGAIAGAIAGKIAKKHPGSKASALLGAL